MNEISPLVGQKVLRVALTSERLNRSKLSSSARAAINVSELLKSELTAELDQLHRRLRGELNYKRKEIVADLTDKNHGRLTTPDFDYTVSFAVLDDRGTEFQWTRELSFAPDLAEAMKDRLLLIFTDDLDTITLHFAQPIDVAELIDRVEAEASPTVKLDYDLNCEWCELEMSGVPATVRFQDRQLRVLRQPGTNVSLPEMFGLLKLQTI